MKRFIKFFLLAMTFLAIGTVADAKDNDVGKSPPQIEVCTICDAPVSYDVTAGVAYEVPAYVSGYILTANTPESPGVIAIKINVKPPGQGDTNDERLRMQNNPDGKPPVIEIRPVKRE